MTKKDVSQVNKLFAEYLGKFDLTLKLSESEVAHMFLPRNDVVYTYVVENSEKK